MSAARDGLHNRRCDIEVDERRLAGDEKFVMREIRASNHAGSAAGRFAGRHFAPCERIYPAAAIRRRRNIHRFASANSVISCAVFLARPR